MGESIILYDVNAAHLPSNDGSDSEQLMIGIDVVLRIESSVIIGMTDTTIRSGISRFGWACRAQVKTACGHICKMSADRVRKDRERDLDVYGSCD